VHDTWAAAPHDAAARSSTIGASSLTDGEFVIRTARAADASKGTV
jgi:hypothetical protein